jgi:hypothetical protein
MEREKSWYCRKEIRRYCLKLGSVLPVSPEKMGRMNKMMRLYEERGKKERNGEDEEGLSNECVLALLQ